MQIDRYAVLGNPVAHSQSPFIHAQFARQTGQPLAYERVLCPMDGFAAAVRAFAAAGGRGCNVTVPFKLDAQRLAARCSPRALLAGAANLLCLDAAPCGPGGQSGGGSESGPDGRSDGGFDVRSDVGSNDRSDDRSDGRSDGRSNGRSDGVPDDLSNGGWFADNTDGIGLLRDIQHNAGVAVAGQRVLLVGAGGAAAGVLGPLLAARPAVVVVANRTPHKAQALVDRHADWAQAHGVALSATGLDAPGTGFGIVLNASASSLQGQAAPVPASTPAPGALALDLMYGAAAEPFLAWARAAGAHPRDGLGMLVEQAAEAFAVWRGTMPQTRPVLAALRSRLAAPTDRLTD